MSGQVVIVTGGARGIGLAYGEMLAAAGWRVVLADVIDAEPEAQRIREDGGEALALQVDVTDEDSIRAMVQAAADAFGGIDALVNNAARFGDMQRAPYDEIPVDEWDRVFAVNTRGAWLCTRAVAPFMRSRGGGRVVNIGSSTVAAGTYDAVHYVASKAALIGLTRSLARALGSDGISVNLLVPDRIPHAGIPTLPDAVEDQIASGRAFARRSTPDDLFGALRFLLGLDSGFITGQLLIVDGGRHFSAL